MASSNDIDMIVNPLNNLFDIGDNFDEVRSYSLALDTHRPKSPSLSSNDCEKEYHIRVKKVCNRIDKDNPVASASSIQIEYAIQEGQNGQVSKVADNTSNACQQCVSNKDLALNQPFGNNVFNSQLNYDID